MTSIAFNKYQGAGNDFIIIDNRQDIINPDSSELINRLCDRRFGIGADGLILVSLHPDTDYEMKYFNADGFIGSMCGNGGRCVAHFCLKHGIAGEHQRFMAYDGIHQAFVSGQSVKLQMGDVSTWEMIDNSYFINTGSPHYMVFSENIDNIDLPVEGKKLRWDKKFGSGGTNVNFVETKPEGLYIRTFERGVEEETLACGTGVTASAIAAVLKGHFVTGPVNVKARGGDLKVDFKRNGDKITDIWLTGPATYVFEGFIED